ncbi:MAG: hypothetical protein WC121_06445 [Candidatus Kapaibacterium sp.]
MKLAEVLDKLNTLEKLPFIKILDDIRGNLTKNNKKLDQILSAIDESGLKNADSILISELFDFLEEEFVKNINSEFVNISSQLDFLIDIIIRDGNCVMRQDWFSQLYTAELKKIKKKSLDLKNELENEKSDLTEQKKRDYNIYKSCVHTAYYNDIANNRDSVITNDELSILLTLSQKLELSQEEIKLINYTIVTPQPADVETVINNLKRMGVIFFSKKNNTIYVADEVVRILRKIRGKQIADKYLRRILKLLSEPKVNVICRNYNLDTKLSYEDKIRDIINEGISFKYLMSDGIYKGQMNLTDKKKFLNDFWNKSLIQSGTLKGVTVEEKIDSIIDYFNQVEKDEKVGISIDGYERLIIDLADSIPKLNGTLKRIFELQDENVIDSALLLDYNIKPRDVLDILEASDISNFCTKKEISTRGNEYENILKEYKDYDNLFLENYVSIGLRDLNTLKANGLKISEAEIGLKFEELTRTIFSQLGFNVDDLVKKEIDTKKEKIDIFINLGNRELILVECKSVKESGYNKFSSVSRQMKAYAEAANRNGYRIVKSLLVAPDFSDEFINDTNDEFELNLSLIRASTLLRILDAFKSAKKHKIFPYKLLMRDVVIDEDRIVKAISK